MKNMIPAKSLKTFGFLILCLSTSMSFSQNVGINATGAAPAASAGLDVSFTNRGLLIPNVALTSVTSATPITSPATSLLVYNTATAGTFPNNVTPGYYYWTGSAWTRLSNGAQGGWGLNGNAGTNATNHFIGTTDAQDLVLKSNSVEGLRVQSSGDVRIANTLKANTELVLRQDGDTYGPSILRLRNRNSENGAIFETTDPTITLVDFIFKTSNSQSNIRMEGRTPDTYTGSAPEWQFGAAADPTFVTNHSGTTFVRKGKFGVGVSNPEASLHLKAGAATAGNAPLKFTSGTNLTTPESGTMEFDGTNYFVTSGSTRYTMAKVLTGSATLNFPSTSARTDQELTITVTGAEVGDPVVLGVPPGSYSANSVYSAYVSATNTVMIRFNNYTSSSIDPASGVFKVSVLKY